MKSLKFNLLALSILSTSAYAYTPVTGSAWTDQIEFKGTVINSAPDWEFEIPTETIAAVSSIELDIADSLGPQSGMHVWEQADWVGTELLRGQLQELADKGQPGLTPEITVNGVVIEGSEEAPSVVNLTVVGDNDAEGSITLNLIQGVVIGQGTTEGHSIITNGLDMSDSIKSLLIERMKAYSSYSSAPWLDNNSPGNMTTVWAKTDYWKETNQNIGSTTNVYVSQPLKVEFPEKQVPSTWTGSLSIEVAII